VGKTSELSEIQIKRGEKIHYIKLGEMIGHQNIAEQNGIMGEDKWKYDIFAETDGVMAVLPYGEVKLEMRR
jgi:hypothetical protein